MSHRPTLSSLARRSALGLLPRLGLTVVPAGPGTRVVTRRPKTRAVDVLRGVRVVTDRRGLRVKKIDDDAALVTTSDQVSTVRVGSGDVLVTRPKPPKWISVKHEKALNDHLASQHIAAVLAHYRVNCVLDVGANTGQYVKKLRAAGYTGWVISFEPVASTFAELAQAAEADDRWTVHQMALGREDGTVEMQVTPGTFSSLLSPTEYGTQRYQQLNEITVQEVQVRRLDALLDEVTAHVPDRRIYLKMDTQGFDLEAFGGLGDRASDIVALQSEVAFLTIYEGMPRYAESISTYEAAGFEVTGLYPVSRERRTGRVLEFDCVMVRASEAPEPA